MSRREFLRTLIHIFILSTLWRRLSGNGYEGHPSKEENDSREVMYLLDYHAEEVNKGEISKRLPGKRAKIHFMRENPPWERVLAFVRSG